jgi:predicted RNA-binding protein with PUA-like domain
MRHWLFKSEPDVFGIEDLARAPRKTTSWDGVRNYQVRNLLRDEVRRGDLGFFYHSSCPVPGIAGIVEVVREAHPDKSALDPKSPYHDPRATRDEPIWLSVDVRLHRRFSRVITLDELRAHADGALAQMLILRRGNRLSVTPVSESEWRHIVAME